MKIDRKGIIIGEILEFIIIVILPLYTGFMFVYLLNSQLTPVPSYFYLNSKIAEIGLIPNNDNKAFFSGNYREKIYMDEAPFIKNGEIYLPVKFAAIANGINEKDIVYRKNILTIIKEKDKIIIDGNKKIIKNKGKINCPGELLLIKNNEIFLPASYIEKLFNVKIEVKNDRIILRNNLFANIYN